MNFNALFADRKIQVWILCIIIALGLIFLKDLNPTTLDSNFGIEFIGGVRIPVTLEKSVDSDTMALMVDTIKQRINKYGLSQAVVRPLGSNQIIVEIPNADSSAIKSIEEILREQGHFQAIIDGKEAINGGDIISGSVGGAANEQITKNDQGVGWELGFAVDKSGAEKFSKAALGKPNYPVYMFLDRPSDAVVLIDESSLSEFTALNKQSIDDALKKESDSITLVYFSEFESKKDLIFNKTVLVVSSKLIDSNASIYSQILSAGFKTENSSKRLLLKPDEELIPHTYTTEKGVLVVSDWKAIGLLSGPVLSPSLANGMVSQFYQVTGSGSGSTAKEQEESARKELKTLKVVISSGKLPVSTIVGSSYSIASSLSSQFIVYSFIALFVAAIVVAGLIVARYKKFKLAIPIVLVNFSEVVILFSIVGGFGTLDLAAMAGIITLIGTGVDDQIIITDEVMRRHHRKDGEKEEEISTIERVKRAFSIIMTNASVVIVAMLPLLLSGIVEITGFALATILGVIIGVFITRPAFGVIIEHLYPRT